jgi:hypothetical protein
MSEQKLTTPYRAGRRMVAEMNHRHRATGKPHAAREVT